MDVMPSTSRCNSAVNKQSNSIEIELYYLIAKYLSEGPCKKAYEVLKAEIEENQLLPKRYDWLGNEHNKSYHEVDSENGHLSPQHLLQIVQRLGPAINQLVRLPHAQANTLLGAGTQSLLRSEHDLTKKYNSLRAAVVRQRGNPPVDPLRCQGPPSLTHVVVAREVQGSFNRRHVVNNKFYSQIQFYVRSVGHLSAVYCLLFDKTGKYIITGADDTLVKIWSTLDGRLLATLRGASAEISDIAIDGENKLIAAGSCDKVIRVWSLQTLAPVAVLTSHTGMVTALQFCPAPDSEGVLVSTGGDGCVCFWTYTRRQGEIKFDSKPLKVNERVRPGNAQLICASFSAGGHFLAVGGADHFVRVYHLGGEDGIEKLIETERHQDRVDSIQWCHNGLMFVSGSRDGTALVWRYERQQWKNVVLNMAERLPGDPPPQEEVKRLQVTMVGWNRSDKYVVTASTDKCVRVWDMSEGGKLKHILRGHEDDAYVIESHPFEDDIILTAAHDGQLMIWDLSTGTLIRSFKNAIEGQGHGALFDAKWSPDGYTIATTDSHGHLILFGIGHNEKFKKIPKELFFHTDYRPLMRDNNQHVLDEQTQMAPHLMPPPFLVNMDGNPYPPEYQRLVPGRENCRHDQLIPNILLNANGDQEVLDAAVADNQEHQFPGPPPPPPPPPQPPPPLEPPPTPGPSAQAGSSQDSAGRPNIDEMIQRLAQEQDERIAHDRRLSESGPDQPGPSGVRERRESSSSTRGERRASSGGPPMDHSYAVAALHDPLSPRGSRVGARRVGDVEGVRQSTGNWQRDPNMKWNRRIIVRQEQHHQIRQNTQMRRLLGDMELATYAEERSKRPEPIKSPVQQHVEQDKKSKKRQQKKAKHSYPTRSGRESVWRAPFQMADLDEPVHPPSSSGNSSESEIENEELQESSSSDDQSTDYSDWTAEAGLEPPKRTAHKQKKKVPKRGNRRGSSDDDEDKEHKDDDDDDDDDDDVVNRRKRPEKRETSSTPGEQRRLRGLRVNLSEPSTDEIPEEYRPPEWLTETFPKKAPYFPQMGDELIYFMQGHMLYVEAVMNRKLYNVEKRSLPWLRTDNKLRDQEHVKIIGIKYEIKPPRLCCLKLGIMDSGRGKLTSDSFTIKYHDMPDVLDFLILKATYDVATRRHWKTGDRFRCIIDDAWWLGTVENQEPHLPEFPDSMFMCYRVLWDNMERERLSPWDMELIDEDMEVAETGGSVPVKQEELEELLYTPSYDEWAGRDRDDECDRISHGLSLIMSLSAAEPFLVPVDLNSYPDYALLIDYPMDLTTVKSRLDNRFYRRINAVQFDVRYIATNTEKFNQKGSNIVRQARIVTELCLKLIKDSTCTDPTPLYHELQANYHSPNHSDDDLTGARPGGSKGGHGKGGHGKGKQAPADKRSWQQMSKDLLRSIFEREDSMPFRYPVDLDRYMDYSQVIDIPMDLTTVREELATSAYQTPHDFAKDMRLIFINSKNYNTNKRSRIYSMTLRLEAYFEDQLKPILSAYKSKGKLGPYKMARDPKGKFISASQRVESGHNAIQSGATWNRVSSGNQGGGRGAPHRKTPASRHGSPAASRSGASGRTGGPRAKQGGAPSTETPAPCTSITSFGRAVVPPQRADFSFSTTFEEEANSHDDAEQELGTSNDGMRRSRRVARLKGNRSDDQDSGEEYNPKNRKNKSATSKGKKKGVATRNRGKVTVQYREDSEEEADLHLRNVAVNFNKNKKRNVVESESDDDDDDDAAGCDIPGPSTKRTNGQIFGSKRLESSSGSESDDEDNPTKDRSNGVNGVANVGTSAPHIGVKKIQNIGVKRIQSESEDSESSSDSSSLSGDEKVVSKVDKSTEQTRKKNNFPKRKHYSSDSSSSVDKVSSKDNRHRVILPLPIIKPKSQSSKAREESEVEFDEDELESSTEESGEEEVGKKRRGVASSVRRAKRYYDDEDDRDLIDDRPDDNDFIDDGDLTEESSSSQSESEECSDDDIAPKKKKKGKSKTKGSKKKKTPKKKSPPKKSSKKKKQPPKKKYKSKSKSHQRSGQVQELITINRPGQAPIPYKPINLQAQSVTVNNVKHKGRVVGRVITSAYGGGDDSESESEESDSDDSDYPPPKKTKINKRSYESDSDYGEGGGGRRGKRGRYAEPEGEEVDVSSRGRVRKANTLMRDFI